MKLLLEMYIQLYNSSFIGKVMLLWCAIWMIFIAIPLLYLAGFALGLAHFQNPHKTAIDIIKST